MRKRLLGMSLRKGRGPWQGRSPGHPWQQPGQGWYADMLHCHTGPRCLDALCLHRANRCPGLQCPHICCTWVLASLVSPVRLGPGIPGVCAVSPLQTPVRKRMQARHSVQLWPYSLALLAAAA